MGRAAVTYRSKEELSEMSAQELNEYIIWLKNRASFLGTLPSKAVQKYIDVATKIYIQLTSLNNT